ncbi:MAG: Asp-tRNA(Asn)/Glu-tRNA(Gln) amidotransferase subunit GatC [Gammaproteobacteria bacterium]
MALSTAEVNHIAELARLGINAADVPEYVRNLTRILEFVAQLERTDTRDVAPLASPLEEVQRLRVDVVSDTGNPALFQQNAPRVEAGLYIVPKVID